MCERDCVRSGPLSVSRPGVEEYNKTINIKHISQTTLVVLTAIITFLEETDDTLVLYSPGSTHSSGLCPKLTQII